MNHSRVLLTWSQWDLNPGASNILIRKSSFKGSSFMQCTFAHGRALLIRSRFLPPTVPHWWLLVDYSLEHFIMLRGCWMVGLEEKWSIMLFCLCFHQCSILILVPAVTQNTAITHLNGRGFHKVYQSLTCVLKPSQHQNIQHIVHVNTMVVLATKPWILQSICKVNFLFFHSAGPSTHQLRCFLYWSSHRVQQCTRRRGQAPLTCLYNYK